MSRRGAGPRGSTGMPLEGVRRRTPAPAAPCYTRSSTRPRAAERSFMPLARIVRLAVVALAAAGLFVPASEAAPKNGRGNIQAVDWNVMQMAIKGVDGKVNTFRVRR